MTARQPDARSAVYGVPPVARALKVLRHIAAGDPILNLAASARALGINRTTLMRLLATLNAERMIEPRCEGGWRLGLGLAGLAGQALFASDIVTVADPVLGELAETLALSSHLGVLDGRDVLYVARRTPNLHLVSNVRIGSRLPAHATTLGRIILAHMPRDAVANIFRGAKLEARSEKTPTTLQALQRLIEDDARAGLAWSDSNFEAGISSVAAPVFDRTGEIMGGINVTGPTRSFETSVQRRAEIGQAVAMAASHISRRLGFAKEIEDKPRKVEPEPPSRQVRRPSKLERTSP